RAGVHRVLALRRRRDRRHECQRVGRQRRHPNPDPRRPPGRPRPPHQPRHPPNRSLTHITPSRSAPLAAIRAARRDRGDPSAPPKAAVASAPPRSPHWHRGWHLQHAFLHACIHSNSTSHLFPEHRNGGKLTWWIWALWLIRGTGIPLINRITRINHAICGGEPIVSSRRHTVLHGK